MRLAIAVASNNAARLVKMRLPGLRRGTIPVMEHATRVGNRLLAALPPADFALLAPHLRKVPLEHDAVLVRSGDKIEHIYFPCSGAIAFIMELPNGQTAATAVIGNDGAVGLMTALGPTRSPMTAIVRVAGTALQISPVRFHTALERSTALATAVQILSRALMTQFQHVAACNALHSVEARLARWLLHIHDRTDGGDILPLTQETLSELLGVRRTTVTHVVSALRASRAIKSSRRGQLEIDRDRLEMIACECYKVMSRRIGRIVSQDAPRLLHAAPERNGCPPPDFPFAKTDS
ncbi:Crp/Fnr family transcriptional regulator [Bradyrhizobium sp. B117]|uniref:Crp/Fnr family transcriptional regulator n=1 Tax=Bradyrhizobium sp. B117 TaxID=3140246 RepID=UPI0031836ABD